MSARAIVTSVIVATALLALAGEYFRRDDTGSAWHTADSLRAVVERVAFERDTLKARHAEQEVAAEKQADSLRGVIAGVRMRPVVVRHDTAFVPESTWVYVTDTLIPSCERCAARVDSLVSQSRIERTLSDSLLRGYRDQRDAFQRIAVRERRKARLLPWIAAGAFVAGAWVRGQ